MDNHFIPYLGNEKTSYEPWYNTNSDFNTNSKSYYDYLSRVNKYLQYMNDIVNKVSDRLEEFEYIYNNIEVIEARTDMNGVTHERLKNRLYATDLSIEELENEIVNARITFPNLSERLSSDFNIRGINPEWFLGTDTEKINQAIEKCYLLNQPLLLGKDYEIDSLTITKNLTVYGNGKKLITNKTNIVTFITIKRVGSESINVTLNDLEIINTKGVQTGLKNDDEQLDLTNVSITGFDVRNVHYVKKNIGGFGIIRNLMCYTSEIGVHLESTDVKIYGMQSINCRTHIKGLGGSCYVENLHGWNSNDGKDWVSGSCLIEVSGTSVISNVYADTVEVGIKLPNDDFQWHCVVVSNLNFFLNRSFYPTQTETNGIKAPRVFSSLTGYSGKLAVSNMIVDFNGWNDKDGYQPKLFDGMIHKNRMTFQGLTQNGANDNHAINPRMTGDMNGVIEVTSGSAIDISTGKYHLHQGELILNLIFTINSRIFQGYSGGKFKINNTYYFDFNTEYVVYTASCVGVNSDGETVNVPIVYTNGYYHVYNPNTNPLDNLLYIQLHVKTNIY